MAHDGQKLALRAIGGFGRLLRLTQRGLGRVALGERVAHVVLPGASAERRAHDGDERRHADGSLEQRHVRAAREIPHALREHPRELSFGGEQDDGQIRPVRLPAERREQLAAGVLAERLLRENDDRHAARDRGAERRHVGVGNRAHVPALEHASGQGAILARGRQHRHFLAATTFRAMLA